jgi:acyl-CoA reductase-like NAD-dependent aldehyde dehydrogenase
LANSSRFSVILSAIALTFLPLIFTVTEGTKEDAEQAILAARRSFENGEWSQETSEVRCLTSI